MAALEDAGYYCVDNMPVSLLPAFLDLPDRNDLEGLAFVMDLREKGFLDTCHEVFANVTKRCLRFQILFLEASEEVLLQRYSETRRSHPLAKTDGVLNGIRTERMQMAQLRSEAHIVIDTSHYTVHELKALVFEMTRESGEIHRLKVHILTFGFKFGLPPDADLVTDVRFLQNPYFIPHLMPLDGRTHEIQSYVFQNEDSQIFILKYLDFIDFLLPLYEREGKSYLTIAIGCTGGRHRSVAVACRLFSHIQSPRRWVQISHRDITK